MLHHHNTWLSIVSVEPVLCPLRPSSARSTDPSLSWVWRWCSREVRACLSAELFISSSPDGAPETGVRSRDEAFRSVGGTMLLMLRAPGIRLCPWQGGGSGGGGRSAKGGNHKISKSEDSNHVWTNTQTRHTLYYEVCLIWAFVYSVSKRTTDVLGTRCVNYLKSLFSHWLTVCTSISPVGGCCAVVSGFACGPGSPLVA